MSSISLTKRARLALGATGVVLALAGCSGGKSTPAAASTTAASATTTAAPASGGPTSGGQGAGGAFGQYQDCLRAHGAPVPTFSPGARRSGSGGPTDGTFSRPPGGFGGSRGPGGFGLGPDASANPSFAAAIQACASVRPSGGIGGAGRNISAATLAAFASCMSDNGVPITGTDAQTVLRGLNRSDAKTAAALKICQPVLGQGFGQALGGAQGGPASGAPLPSSAPAAPSS